MARVISPLATAQAPGWSDARRRNGNFAWRRSGLGSGGASPSYGAFGCKEPAWCGEGDATKAAGVIALLLIWFCGTSALADTFGLGTAGPGNWGVLETGSGGVSFGGGTSVNPSGISVNSGATASQANLGINSGGVLNSSAMTVINGTYYKHTGNSGDAISGTTIVGGTTQSSGGDTTINQAVTDATTASSTLAGLANTQTPPNLNVTGSNVTITGVSGRNVINVPIIKLTNNTLTLTGPANASFVINVSGGVTLIGAKILVGGSVTDANVIINVTGTNNAVLTNGSGVIDGIVMDLGGTETLNAETVNGEVISGSTILWSVEATSKSFRSARSCLNRLSPSISRWVRSA